MADWEIARTTGKCYVTGKAFEPGQYFYTVLLDHEDGFERRDYAEESWEGMPEGGFCHWRGRVPEADTEQTFTVDLELLQHLFVRLEDESSQRKQEFRFVLALLLMRKRLLRLEEELVEDGQRYWKTRLVSDRSAHKVLNPDLSAEHIDRLSAQLMAILSGNVDAVETFDQPYWDEAAQQQETPQGDGDQGEKSAADAESESNTDNAAASEEAPSSEPNESDERDSAEETHVQSS
jgi:hypothetical protein